ncbi:MAG: hypothetical protein GX892_14755 [Thermoanaerobacteraceae bacterium]|nr:hypothetical protein [Thermoanaerobacteraceae bacterium]
MYKCRIFTKDLKVVQDVKDYSINQNNKFTFVADGTSKEYTLDDTEYIIIPTHEFTKMIDKIKGNKKNQSEVKPKKGKRASLGILDEHINKPE